MPHSTFIKIPKYLEIFNNPRYTYRNAWIILYRAMMNVQVHYSVLHDKSELLFFCKTCLSNFVHAQNGDSATFAELQSVIVWACPSECAFLDSQQDFCDSSE